MWPFRALKGWSLQDTHLMHPHKPERRRKSIALSRFYSACCCSVLCLVLLVSTTHSLSQRLPSRTPVLKNGLQHALYINRDSRTDRRRNIERELTKVNVFPTRVSAVEVYDDKELLRQCWDRGSTKCAGQIGCQRSHVKALSMAIKKNWSHVAIFEDDFEWFQHTDDVQSVFMRIEEAVPNWDVIGISMNVKSYARLRSPKIQIGTATFSELIRVKRALATHGYVVRRTMFQELLYVFESCDVKLDLYTAIDTCWQKLQIKYNWYGLHPQLGRQATSFSDIESRVVSYTMEHSTNQWLSAG